VNTTIMPIHRALASGDVYDFGTHANDFLLRREQAQATEVFTVRVPGERAVPEHVHTDMEQTFVFISGVGTASLARAGTRHTFTCRPGDTVFVPIGWHHTVAADSLEGVIYICVNAFVPDQERVGETAFDHADIVAPRFDPAPPVAFDPASAKVAVARSAEATFALFGEDRNRAASFDAFDATLLQCPDAYRVRQVGPFLFPLPVTPVPRIFTASDADLLHAASKGLDLFVEGSQSPIAVKEPCPDSDVDILIAVRTKEDLSKARELAPLLPNVLHHLNVEISVGIVHADWLSLPGFYSALSLNPDSADRAWWHRPGAERQAEAHRRTSAALYKLKEPGHPRRILQRTLLLLGQLTEVSDVTDFQITPRWRGYL
jgi:mannose-6-phosphate isomerase-like protein (cupin superfamily)